MNFKLLWAPCALVLLTGCRSDSATQTPTAPITVEKSAPATVSLPASPTASATAPSATAPSATASSATASSASGQTYRVRGQVAEAPNGAGFLVVKHETIPGFMPAMTMRLPLQNTADAQKVKANDKIAFDMKKGDLKISNIEKLPASTPLKLAK